MRFRFDNLIKTTAQKRDTDEKLSFSFLAKIVNRPVRHSHTHTYKHPMLSNGPEKRRVSKQNACAIFARSFHRNTYPTGVLYAIWNPSFNNKKNVQKTKAATLAHDHWIVRYSEKRESHVLSINLKQVTTTCSDIKQDDCERPRSNMCAECNVSVCVCVCARGGYLLGKVKPIYECFCLYRLDVECFGDDDIVIDGGRREVNRIKIKSETICQVFLWV